MRRRLLLATLPLMITLVIGGIVLWLLGRPTQPLPANLPVSQSPTPIARQTLTDADEAIAWINGNPLPRGALTQRQAVDRALNTLLELPTDDAATSLDRLINEALVLRAAQAAGFAMAPEAALSERKALLAAYGKSEAELSAALQAEGLSLAAFDAYFAQLLTVRDFTNAQAAAEGITQEAYILKLRQAHDVQITAGAVPPPPAQEGTSQPTAALTPDTPSPTPTPTPEANSVTTDEPRGVVEGQRAPDFTLSTLDGTSLALYALAGKPVVLSFWVSWCGHCRAQTPLLVEAHARYGADVHFVGVNVRETRDTVQGYVTEQGVAYPIALDTDGAIAQLFKVSGFPTTVFLNAEGRVVARQIGELTSQVLEQYLNLAWE